MLICQYVARSHVPAYSRTELQSRDSAYPSSHDLTGSIISTSSCSSRRSRLSNWHTSITISIILSPPSLSLTLKILLLSKLFIKGIVSSYLIYCHPSLMPPSIASIYHTILIILILSISKVIPSYSHYIKKGLIYIIITALSSRQPLFYTKYIKVNMHLSCNIYSISAAKYIYYSILLSRLVLCLNCYK